MADFRRTLHGLIQENLTLRGCFFFLSPRGYNDFAPSLHSKKLELTRYSYASFRINLGQTHCIKICDIFRSGTYIIITWGNHDLYLISKRQEKLYKTSFARVENFKQALLEYENIFLLDGDFLELEGVKFWGSGLCGMKYPLIS